MTFAEGKSDSNFAVNDCDSQVNLWLMTVFSLWLTCIIATYSARLLQEALQPRRTELYMCRKNAAETGWICGGYTFAGKMQP